MSSSKRQRAINEDPSDEVIELPRLLHREPEHFLLKIESFSVLSESKIEKYESDEFEADGYKWRLILYPKGDTKRNGSGYVSLYLSISDTKSLPQGWEVKAHFSLFVYNNLSDKYLTFQEGNANAPRRFHGLKTEWGFARLVALAKFKDTSKGYLFNDTCAFGAEVSAITCVPKRQCLSVIKETNNNNTFTWKIDHFSTLKDGCLHSDKFKIGDLQWKLQLYPKGNAEGKGKSLSFYLEAADDELKLTPNWKAYAQYKLRIKNQFNVNHVELQASYWFSKSSFVAWGYPNFVPLSYVEDKSMGYVVNDTLVVEAEITIAAKTKNFT